MTYEDKLANAIRRAARMDFIPEAINDFRNVEGDAIGETMKHYAPLENRNILYDNYDYEHNYTKTFGSEF